MKPIVRRYLKWLLTGIPLQFTSYFTMLIFNFYMKWEISFWIGFIVLNIVSFLLMEFVAYRNEFKKITNKEKGDVIK